MSETDLANYEDDTTSYVSEDSIDDVNKLFEDNTINLLKWFLEMQMKANSNKCHLNINKQIA